MEEHVKLFVLDVDYFVEDGNPVIRIWGKTADGRTAVAFDRKFYPYFYIEIADTLSSADIEDLKKKIRALKDFGERIKKVETVERKLLGNPKMFIKITVKTPGDIKDVRDKVKDWDGVKETYEYDIAFYKRYMIDKSILPMNWVEIKGKGVKTALKVDSAYEIKEIQNSDGDTPQLKIMAIDIEMHRDDIIMISLVMNGYRKVLTHSWPTRCMNGIETLSSEEEMLKRFIEIVNRKDPDIIVTYNGDLFDFKKIRERAEHHGLTITIGRDEENLRNVRRGRIYATKIHGRPHVDIYNFIYHILGSSLSSETLTLDMVANELLGEGKKPMEWEEMETLWEEKRELKRIAEYCEWDSVLTLKLMEKLSVQMIELCKLVGQTIFDTARMTYSQLVEWLLIKHAFRKNEMILNRPKIDEIRRRREASPYTGGFVLPPKPGIHENIALFDFASLYPSIIITHNVSPETLDKNGKGTENRVPDGSHYFSLKKKGFIPEIIEELIKKRREIKKALNTTDETSREHKILYGRQYALKIIANASYGYYAYAGSRWYSRICAMAIASWGRYYIQKVINFAEEKGFEVIYGDTDSLFIGNCDRKKAKKFLEAVNKILPETMDLEFVDIYKSGIFVLSKSGTTAKKRYALLGQDGKILIRGFEKVRRDWCKIAKDTQEKVLLAVLKDRDKEKAMKIVKEVVERIRNENVNKKDLVIYTQITRPLEDYEQIGPHVVAAKRYVMRGHTIHEGSVIGYVITRGSGSISNRAEPVEYAENYDPEYYINNQIIPAAMRILNALDLSEENVLEKEEKGQKSLDSFIKKSLKRKLKEKLKKN